MLLDPDASWARGGDSVRVEFVTMRGPSFLLAVSACTSGPYTESTVIEQGACVALEGRAFASVDERECGRTPDGVATCRWQVSFDIGTLTSSEWSWLYSDVGAAGRATCNDGTITATSGARTIHGLFDAATQRLIWDNVVYVAQ
jgi:hypothetical protein